MDGDTPLSRSLVEALYTEAMLLADEARGYFERYGRAERDALPSLARIDFSCESLKATTRLMHVISWLLTRRAIAAGEIASAQAGADRRLGEARQSDPAAFAHLPETARALIEATMNLYARVERLDGAMIAGSTAIAAAASPARGLIARLQAAF